MKKILFLLLFTIASYGQAVFDEGIQITNTESTTAEKVNVQETDGTLNWQFIKDFQNNKPYFSTGLLKNGLLTINADNTKFDLSAGIGVYSDFSDPENVTSKVFNFPAFNAVVSPYIATSNITYVAIDYNGGSPVLVMQAAPFSNTQTRDLVVVGAVIHSNFATINTINNISSPSNDVGNSVADLFNFLGARNQEGNVYSANGANLQLNKSAGVMFKYGANFHVNSKNPHNVSLPEQLSLTFRYRLQGGFEGTDRINVDTDNYDSNNVLTTVPPAKPYQIQTIFIPQTGFTRIQYGQTTYNTLADAVAAINTRKFVTETNLAAQFVKVAYLVVKKGATSLQVVADADIIQASKFDATASGGVAITYQSIIDALTYVPENVVNKVTSLASPNNTTYPTTQLLKDQLALKANDINVIHNTGNETKNGNLNVIGNFGVNTNSPVGKMTIATGLAGSDIDVAGQENGTVSFSNSGVSTAAPAIVSKSNDASGLIVLSATNDTNPLFDMGFQVSENDNTDFSTLTSTAYSFRRHNTDLLTMLRNGNSTFLGSLKGANFTTDSGDYLVGTKSKGATASFYNNKTVTTHADYGFLEDSDLNYSGVALQAHASFNDNINIIGVQNSDHHHSFQAYPHYGNTGILDNMKGFWMQPDVTAGTVTNLYEFEANNPLGSGIITNLVGLRIRELTRGSSSNYAVFTEGATPSFFSGNTYFGSKIGVGTTAPTANLEVLDVNQTASGDGNATIRSTDSQAADKGGFLTFGGSFSGTSRTVFGGISARKENSTNGNIAGYLSLYSSSPTLGLVEGLRLKSDGVTEFYQIPTAPTAAPGTDTNQVATTAFVLANGGATSGTYTPTLTATANCSSLVLQKATYTKIGDIVTVYLYVTGSTTSLNTTTSLTASLPVPKSTTTSIKCGIFNLGTSGAGAIAFGQASVNQTLATLNGYTSGSSGSNFDFVSTFQYDIND